VETILTKIFFYGNPVADPAMIAGETAAWMWNGDSWAEAIRSDDVHKKTL
jgi:hypothetical protein